MEKIAISKFKATCLAVLERVRKTQRPVLVTRFGKPIAQVVPAKHTSTSTDWLGALSGTGTIRGDIVSPVGAEGDWEALRG
jgi:prevent-host-death family protein